MDIGTFPLAEPNTREGHNYDTQVISSEGAKFYAHKEKLCSTSKVLANSFEAGIIEWNNGASVLKLNSDTNETMLLLGVIYQVPSANLSILDSNTPQPKLKGDRIQALLRCASKYDLPQVFKELDLQLRTFTAGYQRALLPGWPDQERAARVTLPYLKQCALSVLDILKCVGGQPLLSDTCDLAMDTLARLSTHRWAFDVHEDAKRVICSMCGQEQKKINEYVKPCERGCMQEGLGNVGTGCSVGSILSQYQQLLLLEFCLSNIQALQDEQLVLDYVEATNRYRTNQS